jgi:PadR family transcriptional regulator PadR
MAVNYEAWILEACILNVLVSRDAYGYELAKSDMFNISESTIYPILRRLTEKGYLMVSSRIEQARLRKIYSITPEGRNQLAQLKADWHGFQKNVNELLESRMT